MKIVDDERQGAAAGRQGLRRPAGARAVDRQRLLQGRGRRSAAQGRARPGWFPTGDVATIDPDGYMQITDRSKDVIKSGGEWISSIDLENIAVAHPAVQEAAVIGVRHPKWDERPLAGGGEEAGRGGHARGAAQVLRGQDRQVVDARRRGVRRPSCRTPPPASSEAHAAPAVQGLQAARSPFAHDPSPKPRTGCCASRSRARKRRTR